MEAGATAGSGPSVCRPSAGGLAVRVPPEPQTQRCRPAPGMCTCLRGKVGELDMYVCGVR